MLQSPATPTMAASQYMYPMQTLPPEMIYAQLPPQAAFQPGDLGDGSVIETAQAEVGHSSTHLYHVLLVSRWFRITMFFFDVSCWFRVTCFSNSCMFGAKIMAISEDIHQLHATPLYK